MVWGRNILLPHIYRIQIASVQFSGGVVGCSLVVFNPISRVSHIGKIGMDPMVKCKGKGFQ